MNLQAKDTAVASKKRQRGRPKKAITRSTSLVVRLTPTERLSIEGKAKDAGMKISDWFRQSAKTAVIRPRLSKEQAWHLRTLSGVANNLNQLTKLAHVSGLVSLVQDLRKLMKEISGIIESISKDDS